MRTNTLLTRCEQRAVHYFTMSTNSVLTPCKQGAVLSRYSLVLPPPQPLILPFPLSKNRLINSLSSSKNNRLEMLKIQSRLVFLKVVEKARASKGAGRGIRKQWGGPKSPRRGRSWRVRGVGERGRNSGAPQGCKMVEKGGVGNVKCVIIRHNSFGYLKCSSYIC